MLWWLVRKELLEHLMGLRFAIACVLCFVVILSRRSGVTSSREMSLSRASASAYAMADTSPSIFSSAVPASFETTSFSVDTFLRSSVALPTRSGMP